MNHTPCHNNTNSQARFLAINPIRFDAITTVRSIIMASCIILMLPGAWGNSVTIVEFAQLPAGLAAWQRGSLGIYRVCGPVSKLIYSLPPHLAGIRVDYPQEFDGDPRSRQEWSLGRIFQDQNIVRYHHVYKLSRVLPILVTVLVGCLACEWSTRLFGPWPGLAVLGSWCWSPTVLAHGALVTSDIPAAAAALAAARTFWAFLLFPNVARAAIAGICLGIAVATKFTLLIFYPCWIIIGAIQVAYQRASPSKASGLAIVNLLASMIVLNACYFFQGFGLSLADLRSDSSSLLRTLHRSCEDPSLAWLLNVPLPIPIEFLRGIDVQIADGERSQSAYLFGETRLGGWPWWYHCAFFIKTPIPFIILLPLAFASIVRRSRSDRSIALAALCTIVPAAEAAITIASSTGTGTNAAYRYLIPSLALATISIGAIFAEGRRAAQTGLLFLSWLVIDAVAGVPDHISWRNEAAMVWESRNGCPALIGDSLDWSQDVARLHDWIERRGERNRFQVCVYGIGSGDSYGLGQPQVVAATNLNDIATEYLAVSTGVIFGYEPGIFMHIGGCRPSISKTRLEVLRSSIPYELIGCTVRVYNLRDIYAAEIRIQNSADKP